MAVLPLVSRKSRSLFPSPSKSRCPTTDQTEGSCPIAPDDKTFAPFISHTARLPLPSRHTMSLRPSSLASWVALAVGQSHPQAVRNRLPPMGWHGVENPPA